jgi:Ni/Fe-hydrogenase 1 B-type cytochrome subunit
MSVVEPPRADIEHLPQTKRYSSSLRFWHWASALVITGSLLTVLINSTILQGWNTANVIKDRLHQSGATITDDQARSVSHALRDNVWDIHKYFGFVLAALILFRVIAEFFHLTDQKLINKIKVAYHQYQSGKNRLIARHELVVKTLYAILYVLLIIMAITGLCLAFEDDIPALHKIHAIREIHSFCMYLILAFIFVHLAGVFLAERKDGKGIISDMINGGRKD